MKNLLAFFVGILLLSPSLFAQFETSEVLGTVTDPSGAAVANAPIVLKNVGTGIETKTTTDSGGAYDFLDVKVGRYTVTVQLNGFQTFSATEVVVNVNDRLRVDIS